MKRTIAFSFVVVAAASALLSGTVAADSSAAAATHLYHSDYARVESVSTQGLRGNGSGDNFVNRADSNFATQWTRDSVDSFSQILESEVGLAAFQNHLRRSLTSDSDFNLDNWTSGIGARIRSTADALPLRAADTLTDALLSAGVSQAEALRFVREVEAGYQSELGGRKWQFGISALGSLQETRNNVFAWQLRGFGADDSTAGANAGLIYRNIVGNVLWGGNIFLDFEDGDYGEFWRWSLGLESKTKVADFYLNHYVPMSNDRELSDNRIAYSQRGWDAGLGLHLWQHDIFSGGLEYYNFQGEYGQGDERGLRGFVLARPPQVAGLDVRLEYDDNNGDFGGGFVYRHHLNAAKQTRAPQRIDKFTPREHLYDTVRREWSQRIGIAQIGPLPLSVPGADDNGMLPPVHIGDPNNPVDPHNPNDPNNPNFPENLPALGDALHTLFVNGGAGGNRFDVSAVDDPADLNLINTQPENDNLVFYNNGLTSKDGGATYQVVITDREETKTTVSVQLLVNITYRMFVIGGLDAPASGGNPDRLQDIWWTTNGSSWTAATDIPALASSEQYQAVSFNNTIFVIGGNESGDNSQVWSSADGGATWADENNSTLPRVDEFAAVAMGGSMFVIGGTGNGSLGDEVWASTDGASWTRIADSIFTSLPGRTAHAAVVSDGKIFVMGGREDGTTGLYDDVWESDDGITWVRADGGNYFGGEYGTRLFHAAAALNNTLYIAGGQTAGPNSEANDVWTSSNGSASWTQVSTSSNYPARKRHSMLAFNGALYIIAGDDNDGIANNDDDKNDIWRSTDGGVNWTQVTPTTSHFFARYDQAAVVFP